MRETASTRRRHAISAAALLLGLALGITGCNRDSGSAVTATPATNRPADPAPADPVTAIVEAAPTPVEAAPVAGGAPQISFTNRFHDFGSVTDTQKYTTTYPFTNSGTGQLVINEVKAGCGCTVPTLEKTVYAPGESGEITVTFDPKGRKGKATKYVTVKSNSKVENVLQLRFAAAIEPLLKLDRFLQLGSVALGETQKATITATYTDPDLVFEEVSVNDDHMTAEVIETGVVDSSGEDKIVYKATIELTVKDTMPWGTLYAKRMQMKVKGRVSPESDPIDYEYSVYVQGNVYGEIEAMSGSRGGRAKSPTSTISLSTLPAGKPFEANLELIRKNDQPFAVTGAVINEATLPGLEVRYEQLAPNSWSVIIGGDPGDHSGAIRGTITVNTDVSGEENLKIRFAGRLK